MKNRSLPFGRSLLAFLLLTTALFAQIPPSSPPSPLAGNYQVCDADGTPINNGAITTHIRAQNYPDVFVGTVKYNGAELPGEGTTFFMTGYIGYWENDNGTIGAITWTSEGWRTEVLTGPNRGTVRLLKPITD